jgi:hypothetical protein
LPLAGRLSTGPADAGHGLVPQKSPTRAPGFFRGLLGLRPLNDAVIF